MSTKERENKMKKKLTLDRLARYQIIVPGALDSKWLDWNEGIKMGIEDDEQGYPITILTTTVDQAALQGLLRQLYSLGLPLVSVIWVDFDKR
jgi:hypothetical protein